MAVIEDGICKVDNCERPDYAKGYCNAHYQRLTLYGDLMLEKPIKKHHGQRGTPEYMAWHMMRKRCMSPKDKAYKYYGGRGIKVCQRWKDNYLDFLADMGKRPSPKHSLDRIDNDGDYSPENCRWSTKREQMLNRRIPTSNTTGIKGISYRKDKNEWAVSRQDSVRGSLFKRYKTRDEAINGLITHLTRQLIDAERETAEMVRLARISELEWVNRERITLFHSKNSSFRDNQILSEKIKIRLKKLKNKDKI